MEPVTWKVRIVCKTSSKRDFCLYRYLKVSNSSIICCLRMQTLSLFVHIERLVLMIRLVQPRNEEKLKISGGNLVYVHLKNNNLNKTCIYFEH
jgi:hypothetical protein